jgi:hypothetical protein
MTWDFPTAVKRVEFNEDGTQLLGVTEKRMGHLGTIVVLDIKLDVNAEQSPEKVLTIVCDESKATVAGWSYLSKYIIAGHEDGSVSQYDGKTGDLIYKITPHDLGAQVTDLQWSQDRTYFITASKDKTAKLISARDLELLKTYVSDTPLNSATITPKKDFVILGGGQAAMDVTTTAARQGKFEARFYHKIFEEEVGRVRGHFGPLVGFPPRRRGCYCYRACLNADPVISEHRRGGPHRQELCVRGRRRLRPCAPLRQGLLRLPVRGREGAPQQAIVMHRQHAARRAERDTREGVMARTSGRVVFWSKKSLLSWSIDRQAGRRFWQRKCFFAGSFLGCVLLGFDLFLKTVRSPSRKFSALRTASCDRMNTQNGR